MTLTHNVTLDWADAAMDAPRHNGLTPFGRDVVREMNRLGMIVDISHVTPKVMHDVLDVAEAPVMFSHSSAKALTDHPRNVPDDVLRRLQRNGGVVMVTFIPAFVSQSVATWELPLKDVADHIDHVRKMAGVNHVGIGSDFWGDPDMPTGLEDASRFPYLFAELIRRGWSDADLAKLAGGNMLRVMRGAEVSAARIQRQRPASTATFEKRH
jgi:membrane dipeptidase